MAVVSRQQRRFEARKGVRETGFTPYPSRRISGAHAAEVMRLIGNGANPFEAEQQAWRNIATTLPSPRMVPRNRVKPSKNDDPAYRKSIWRASKIARRAA